MSQELAARDLGALAKPPAFDLINERQLALLKNRAAKGCNDAEIGQFLELCVAYGLDPYAQEAWCSKGRGKDGGEGKLLIMVGRDGLRKIAQRQGLRIDGDVVRERDRFVVTRTGNRERSIEHAYEEARREDTGENETSTRGKIVGAWAEVFDEAGRQCGYFYAPLTEYRPTNPKQLQYSPWGSQESVMILAAAERQALRQATPLGGLLAEGEDARIDEQSAPTETTADMLAGWVPTEELAGGVLAVMGHAAQVGHAGLADYATIEMTLKGRSEEDIERWILESWAELKQVEDAQPPAEVVVDAEVVDNRSAEERAQEFEARAVELLDEADAAESTGATERADALRDEATQLREEASAVRA